MSMRPWPLVLFALAVAGPSGSLAAETSTAGPQPTITQPDWERSPTSEAIQAAARSFPKDDAGSAAVVFCSVNAKRTLEGCKVVSQYPDRSDAGRAALQLVQSMRLKPKTKD